MEMAREVGAQTVTLTGLLSSALDYGRDLARAMAGRPGLPAITTGHATTTAAVVMNVERLLQETGRDLAEESVACVGLGSIGWTALRLMLQVFPHPQRLVLCDLFSRREALEGMCRQLGEIGFRGDISLHVVQQGAIAAGVYEQATLLIGATNVGDVGDVARLRPGCLLVDDSAPHCFRPDQAWQRMMEEGDLLMTEGGAVRVPDAWPEAMREVRYAPRFPGQPAIEELMRSEEMIALREDPRQVMGCLCAGLIASALSLPATLGQVEPPVATEHYHALRRAGFHAAAPHLENRVLATVFVQRFRERFGRRRVELGSRM
jgi:hypothetical protein